MKFVLLGWSVQTKLGLLAALMDFTLMKVKCYVVFVPKATTVKQETQSAVVLDNILRMENAKAVLKIITALILVPSLFVQWARHRSIHPAQLVRQSANHVLMAFTAMEIRKPRVLMDINARRVVICQIYARPVPMLQLLKSRPVISAHPENVVL